MNLHFQQKTIKREFRFSEVSGFSLVNATKYCNLLGFQGIIKDYPHPNAIVKVYPTIRILSFKNILSRLIKFTSQNS